MKKTIILIGVLSLLVVLSSCNIFNPGSNTSSPKVKTTVNIIDPYGNKLFVDGTINNFPLKADKNGVYVEAKINAVEKYSFKEPIDQLFTVKSVDFDGKEVNIVLEKKASKGYGIFRTADGKLMFYAFGYADTPYFQIWLKDRLSSHTYVRLNENQTLLAGGWLIGVGKGVGEKGLNRSPDEIYVKLPIAATSAPRIERFEKIDVK